MARHIMVDTPRFPVDEQPLISRGMQSVYAFANLVDDFRAALILFDETAHEKDSLPKDECNRFSVLRKRLFVAARDGGMTIFHIADALEGLGSWFQGTPAFLAEIDTTKFRAARNYFDRAFPHFVGMRDAIAHRAELTKNPASVARNQVSGPLVSPGGRIELKEGATNIIMSNLEGRHFSQSHKGELLSYELSDNTLRELEVVRDTVYEAFAPVEPDHMREMRERMIEMGMKPSEVPL